MTQKLTKNILVKLIKEEIIKANLTEQTMGAITKAEIDRRISNAQAQIRFYKRDLSQMRTQGLGAVGGERLTFRVDRAKGLDYPTGTNTLGKASRFARKMIKKFEKQISDLKALPQYTGLSPARPKASVVDSGPEIGTPMSPIGFDSLPDPIDPKKPATPKKRRRGGRQPRFLRRYRKVIPQFKKRFGAIDGPAFDEFYKQAGVPKRAQDYVFGAGHNRFFQKLMGGGRAGGDVQVSQSAVDAVVREFAKRGAKAGTDTGLAAAVKNGVTAINKLFQGTLTAAEKKSYARQIQKASAGIAARRAGAPAARTAQLPGTPEA